ncbi:MAG: hypothetical protein OXT69_09065 [Candidatus Poribacteria bacterium]|nr:hypothetical protein [Candidatus Poribacteria bacterium]
MLIGLYWFAAILGVGVIVIDMLGLLGDDGNGMDGGDAGDAGDGDGDGGGESGGGGSAVLSVLRFMRIFIYFCVGFGPFGLAAMAFGSPPLVSLLWALGAGAASAFLARLFFRFQRTDLDSSLQEEELLFERATVIVPIPAGGGMGKVRVRVGQLVAERYAVSENSEESFGLDDIVSVARVTDDCVYVRRYDALENRSDNTLKEEPDGNN